MLKYKVLIVLCIIYGSLNGLQFNSRIIGGKNVENDRYSHTISLRYFSQYNHICGGSIISPYHILTAAHCLFYNETIPLNISLLMAVAGNSKLIARLAYYANINKTFVHEKYNDTEYDIAVLKVSKPFPFALPLFNISAISIASREATNGTNCTIIGWGHKNYGVNNLSNHLQEANVTVIDHATCKKKYAKNGILLMDNVICAGDHLTDSCQGDSGGPLICNDTLSGIVAGGVGCAEEDFPGIYTDVYKFRHWIQQVLDNDTKSRNHSMFPNPPILPFVPNTVQNTSAYDNNTFINQTVSHFNGTGIYYNGSFVNNTYINDIYVNSTYNNHTSAYKPGRYPGVAPGWGGPMQKPAKNSYCNIGNLPSNYYLIIALVCNIFRLKYY